MCFDEEQRRSFAQLSSCFFFFWPSLARVKTPSSPKNVSSFCLVIIFLPKKGSGGPCELETLDLSVDVEDAKLLRDYSRLRLLRNLASVRDQVKFQHEAMRRALAAAEEAEDYDRCMVFLSMVLLGTLRGLSRKSSFGRLFCLDHQVRLNVCVFVSLFRFCLCPPRSGVGAKVRGE